MISTTCIRNLPAKITGTPVAFSPCVLIEKETVDIGNSFDEVVDRAEVLMSSEPSLYQKGGELLHLVKDGEQYFLKHLKTSSLKYLLSKHILWKDGENFIHPPSSIANCILDKQGGWKNFRKIRAVVSFPPISSDGSIISSEGYHEHTKVFSYGFGNINVKDRPSREDAKQAVNKLFHIVCDFPFAGNAHKSAWLAGLLSPISRFAHDGNIPIVVVQANAPRVGKTTLVQIISHIVNGVAEPVITHTTNEDEERKRILAYLRVGRTIVLLDNVVGQYGGQTINALATTRTFEDRVLNNSTMLKVQNDTVSFITGNNIILAPDTSERCLNVRLFSTEEKPQLRNNFVHSDLFGMLIERRREFLVAALTILKGYIAAGSPDQNLPAWGSFKEWSNLVRNSIVWAGFEDPAHTREELEAEADIGRFNASAILEGWSDLQNTAHYPSGLTCREAYNLVADEDSLVCPHLREALESLGNGRMPTPLAIGRHLREIKDRNFGGKAMRCAPDPKHAHRWYVEVINK